MQERADSQFLPTPGAEMPTLLTSFELSPCVPFSLFPSLDVYRQNPVNFTQAWWDGLDIIVQSS